jgi:tRNA threonylcarbamoyladenosine biosynthesis protein TsaE
MEKLPETKELVTLEDTRALAIAVAAQYRAGTRLLLLLDGPMGAGKTQFTRFFVAALGGEESSSPSFAIHHNYAVSGVSVEHFDLFRLDSSDDLESTGFWDFFRLKQGILVVEWAERLDELGLVGQLPHSWPKIHLEFSVSPTRCVRIS